MRYLLLIPLLMFLMAFSGTPNGTMSGGVASAPAAPTDYTADANCMGAWGMTGSTTETDLSGEGNTMTNTSGTIPTSADVPSGYSGTSRDFEVADTEDLEGDVTSGTSLHITTTSLSVVAWIKSETTDYATTVHVAGIYDAGNNNRMYRLGVSSAEKAGFYVSVDGTANTAVVSTTTVADGAWHHIAGVFDNANDLIYIYVDGSANGTPVAHVGNISSQTEEFSIGGFNTASSLFDGLIDEVAVFNRVLTPTEIADIYTNGITGATGE